MIAARSVTSHPFYPKKKCTPYRIHFLLAQMRTDIKSYALFFRELDELRSKLFQKDVDHKKIVAKWEEELKELRKNLQRSEQGNKQLGDCLNAKGLELIKLQANTEKITKMLDSLKKENEDLKAVSKFFNKTPCCLKLLDM